jgi:hypothetical protein
VLISSGVHQVAEICLLLHSKRFPASFASVLLAPSSGECDGGKVGPAVFDFWRKTAFILLPGRFDAIVATTSPFKRNQNGVFGVANRPLKTKWREAEVDADLGRLTPVPGCSPFPPSTHTVMAGTMLQQL